MLICVGHSLSKSRRPFRRRRNGPLRPSCPIPLPIPPGSKVISVLAIGFIRDDAILDPKSTKGLVEAGRNVDWKITQMFSIKKPAEKNNVRLNSLYEEFHPDVQAEIIKRLTT